MNKIYLSTIILLLLVIASGIYKFSLQPNVAVSTDGRTPIVLSVSERDLVLAEMRAFLNSAQQISLGIAENNMQAVILAARSSGKMAQAKVPESLAKKLPVQFKKTGADTHIRFDQLAMDADDLGDADHALEQLARLMQNCVSCHAVYRIDPQN